MREIFLLKDEFFDGVIRTPEELRGSFVYNYPLNLMENEESLYNGYVSIDFSNGIIYTNLPTFSTEDLDKLLQITSRLSSEFFDEVGYGMYRFKKDLKIQEEDATGRKDRQKQGFLDCIEELNKIKLFKESLEKKESILRKYKLDRDGDVYFEYNDVYAEDTEGEGEEIFLGDITIRANIYDQRFNIDSGTECRNGKYNSEAYHPHHLSNSICTGSNEADIIECLKTFELDVVAVLFDKFVHSYTSTDSAGGDWVKWCDDYDENEGKVYVPSRDDWYYEEDCIYSEYHEEDIYIDDSMYSVILNDYLLESESVVLENDRGWMPLDHPEVVCIDGVYYYVEDVVTDINRDEVPKDDCEYSEALGEYILREDVIKYEGDFYTEDTLPTPEEDELPHP